MQMRVFHFQARNRQVHKHAIFNVTRATVKTAGYVENRMNRKKGTHTHTASHSMSATDAQPKTAYSNSFHSLRNYMRERVNPFLSPAPTPS